MRAHRRGRARVGRIAWRATLGVACLLGLVVPRSIHALVGPEQVIEIDDDCAIVVTALGLASESQLGQAELDVRRVVTAFNVALMSDTMKAKVKESCGGQPVIDRYGKRVLFISVYRDLPRLVLAFTPTPPGGPLNTIEVDVGDYDELKNHVDGPLAEEIESIRLPEDIAHEIEHTKGSLDPETDPSKTGPAVDCANTVLRELGFGHQRTIYERQVLTDAGIFKAATYTSDGGIGRVLHGSLEQATETIENRVPGQGTGTSGFDLPSGLTNIADHPCGSGRCYTPASTDDEDLDGVEDGIDNCPCVANPRQSPCEVTPNLDGGTGSDSGPPEDGGTTPGDAGVLPDGGDADAGGDAGVPLDFVVARTNIAFSHDGFDDVRSRSCPVRLSPVTAENQDTEAVSVTVTTGTSEISGDPASFTVDPGQTETFRPTLECTPRASFMDAFEVRAVGMSSGRVAVRTIDFTYTREYENVDAAFFTSPDTVMFTFNPNDQTRCGRRITTVGVENGDEDESITFSISTQNAEITVSTAMLALASFQSASFDINQTCASASAFTAFVDVVGTGDTSAAMVTHAIEVEGVPQ